MATFPWLLWPTGCGNSMQDMQNQQAEIPMPIDRVGVRCIRIPLTISDRANGSQHTVAEVSLDVDLPAHFKGTHMSRFLEALEGWQEDLGYHNLKHLLESVRERLCAQRAHAVFQFPFFMRKKAPATGAEGVQGYDCTLKGTLEAEQKPHLELQVVVPVMTVCPCSKAISREGAHSQRADVRIAVTLKGFSWLEEFIEIAERASSSPTYPLIKRQDEKFVTESAFATPMFVEDVVRSAAQQLEAHPQVQWFRVEVESYESIHAHNAFALIERHCEPKEA